MKLSNLIPQDSNIIIAIDGEVFQNSEGKYLVNVGYLRAACINDIFTPSNLNIQRAEIERYCHNEGITNLVLFIDNGYSGCTFERPGIQKFISMLNEQRTGMSEIRFSKFIVHKIDRLSRKLYDCIDFINKYLMLNAGSQAKRKSVDEYIDFISTSENITFEKNNPQSIFMLNVYSSILELERSMIVDKIKSSRAACKTFYHSPTAKKKGNLK